MRKPDLLLMGAAVCLALWACDSKPAEDAAEIPTDDAAEFEIPTDATGKEVALELGFDLNGRKPLTQADCLNGASLESEGLVAGCSKGRNKFYGRIAHWHDDDRTQKRADRLLLGDQKIFEMKWRPDGSAVEELDFLAKSITKYDDQGRITLTATEVENMAISSRLVADEVEGTVYSDDGDVCIRYVQRMVDGTCELSDIDTVSEKLKTFVGSACDSRDFGYALEKTTTLCTDPAARAAEAQKKEEAKNASQPGIEVREVDGSLSAIAVGDAVAAHRLHMKFCLGREWKQRKDRPKVMHASYEISADGRVTGFDLEFPDVETPASVDECMQKIVAKHAKFPVAEDLTTATVALDLTVAKRFTRPK